MFGGAAPSPFAAPDAVNRIRLIDWLSGKCTWRYYREYCATQWYPRPRMEAYRVAKLRRLLAHCERHVPFYREVMRTQGLRADQVDNLRVLERFPIIDKSTVKARYEDFAAVGARGLGHVRYSWTGGTTGEPLRVPKDVALRSSVQAAMYRFYDWMGVRLGDPVLVLWGAPIVGGWKKRLRDAILDAITNTRRVDSFRLSPRDVPALAARLRRDRPVLLHGYCLSLYELARWFVEAGERVPLRAVSTTVEPLFPEYRPVFRQAFACDVFDQYGCGEVEAIAMECGSHEGLHVIEERVVLELDAEGNVIVTDLDNFAFPFIRYRNGDQAVAAERGCSCGRPHRLLERILGRVGDVIVGPSGRRVHPEFFTHLINETGVSTRRRLRRYQVVQESPSRLTWRLVADALDEQERRALIERVRAYLGPVDIRIEEVDDIPVGRSGKFQYVIARR